MVFEGVVGPSYTGDISIDDVSVLPGQCTAYGSCNFEQDLCGWTPRANANDFDWYRLSAKQIGLFYNGTNYPLTDTTTNNPYGHFLWAASDFRNSSVNKSSYLYSEIFLAYKYQGGACLTFSYWLTGTSTLNIFQRNRPAGQNSTLIWSMDNDQGKYWFQDEIDIPVVASDFEVNIHLNSSIKSDLNHYF